MRRLTLALLVDAIRPDYLRHAPFIRSLAGAGAGELREPFGFLPRAAYFGGLTPEEFGYSNMYAFDPARSPFRAARALPTRRTGASALDALDVRAFIDAVAREQLPPFARAYATSGRIPLDLLPRFSVVEQHAPWEQKAGYHSIFHELDERGMRWFEVSWPGTNALADRTDGGIVAEALRRATDDMRFGYVHLQALDACGHTFGPSSAETRDCIVETDRLVERLVQTLRSRFDAVDLLLFGDHGMVSVTRGVDILRMLDDLPLERGIDYTPFVDSTMVRVWTHGARARAMLPEVLRQAEGARLLTDADRRRMHIAGCDPRNGDLLLLAEPGVVFLPNFFQGDRLLPRGMHGYDPDCPDNRGVFIAHADDVAPRRDVVDATELHGMLRALLFDDVRAPVPAGDVCAGPDNAATRFTMRAEEPAQAVVRGHLDAITRAVCEVAEPRAIVLTGSFGRGEGGVARDGDTFRPVNDYDVLVVGGPSHPPLDRLSRSLPRRLGIDYVDLSWSDGAWDSVPASMANFDLKYGSTVIYGAGDALEPMPDLAAGDIPLVDALQLLLNRTAGLLTGLRREPSPTEPARRYLLNQCVKASIAIGDSWLVAWQAYDASYLVRGRRFRSLASGAGVEPALVDRVADAYAMKLAPDYESPRDPYAEVLDLAPALIGRITQVIDACSGRNAASLEDALDHYVAMPLVPDLAADNQRVMQCEAVATLVRDVPSDHSVRQLVYAVLPLVLRAATASSPACRPADWRPAHWLSLPERVDGWAAWESMRGRVVDAWFGLVH
jgi:hypothetical protein